MEIRRAKRRCALSLGPLDVTWWVETWCDVLDANSERFEGPDLVKDFGNEEGDKEGGN